MWRFFCSAPFSHFPMGTVSIPTFYPPLKQSSSLFPASTHGAANGRSATIVLFVTTPRASFRSRSPSPLTGDSRRQGAFVVSQLEVESLAIIGVEREEHERDSDGEERYKKVLFSSFVSLITITSLAYIPTGHHNHNTAQNGPPTTFQNCIFRIKLSCSVATIPIRDTTAVHGLGMTHAVTPSHQLGLGPRGLQVSTPNQVYPI